MEAEWLELGLWAWVFAPEEQHVYSYRRHLNFSPSVGATGV